MVRSVVVLSDTSFIDGGGAAVALGSAIALARAGIRVTVVSAVGPAMPQLLGEPGLTVLCSDQVHLAASPLAAARHNVWNDPAAALVERALTGCDPNDTVVHVHGWTKALSASVFHAATRLGFSVVVTLHDFFSICPNGSLYLHPDKKICTIAPMSPACIAKNCDSRNYAVKLYRVARQLIQRNAGGMPGAVKDFISVSAFSQRIIEPHLPANANFYPVQNPIDRMHEPAATPEHYARFLYVGRLSPEKGATLFARAARAARVACAFAGDGPDGDAVTRQNPDAELLGWLPPARVDAELRASRALVLPSLWYETYGMSVMEAAAAGVPAIVPDTSAARELVIPNETGLWFEGGNASSLAAALGTLAEPGTAARMGEAAYRRYWNDPPTMAKHIASLRDVYERLLAHRGSE